MQLIGMGCEYFDWNKYTKKKTAFEQDHPGPARKQSSNMYDIF